MEGARGAGAAPVSWKSVADFLHHKYYCAHTHTHTHTHTHIGWRLRSAVESIIQIPVPPQVQQTLSLSPSLTSLCLLFCYATYPQHPLSLLLSLDSSKFIPQSISAWFLSLLYPNLFLYLISSFLSFSFFQCVPKDCFFIIFNQ